jgi:hypothetical protein
MSNAEVREHYSKAASLGCVACRKDGRGFVAAQLHHPFGRIGIKEKMVIPLCPPHHMIQYQGIHPSVHGSKKEFVAQYGTEMELLDYVAELLAQDSTK